MGRELCIELSKHGCRVAIADIDYDGALKTIELMDNSEAKAYKIDLCKKEEISSLKDQLLNDFGTVDILVNNAGLMSYSTVFHETEEYIEKMIKVNMIAPILLVRSLMPLMINQKSGHLVTISSVQGLYHLPCSVVYSASKFGVTGFMMGMRELIRCKNLDQIIRTTTVYPYPIETNDVANNALRKGASIKVFQPKEVAVEVVKAILINKHEISMPKNKHKEVRVFHIFPHWLQNMIRDKFLNESSWFISLGMDDI